MNLNEVPVETLCRAWLDAKRDEDEAADRRKAIAASIVERCAFADLEGTDRREFGTIKLVVGHKLSRTVDSKALTLDWTQLPETVQKTFRWKAELELKNLRALEFASPADYSIAATYVTSKPASPSISVEEVQP